MIDGSIVGIMVDGLVVRSAVSSSDGLSVGFNVGVVVGSSDGTTVGASVGV
jgi:hypothetical protein